MFARFDENPAMTLQDIKKKKTLWTDVRTDAHTDAHTHRRENSIPTTNKVCGGYKHARTHTRMHTHTHRQRENSIPTTNKVCRGGGGGINIQHAELKKKYMNQIILFLSPILLNNITEPGHLWLLLESCGIVYKNRS